MTQFSIDGRTTRHATAEASLLARKLIEEAFGSMKSGAGMRRPMLRDLDRFSVAFTCTFVVCDLKRLPRLLAGHAP